MKEVIVLGAGIAGLSAAWQVGLLKGYHVDVYEKSDRISGLCGFYDFNGIRLDYGPHKIYSLLTGAMRAFQSVGAGRLKEISRKHKIILRGKLLRYPVELSQVLSIFTPREIAELGLSVAAAMATQPFSKEAVSFEDYCVNAFGGKIYEVVFKPLAEKVWGDPKRLSADIAKRRIPAGNIYNLILRVLKLKSQSAKTSADAILYPAHGFHDICDAIAEEIKKAGHAIHLKRRPEGIRLKESRIESVIVDGGEKRCDLVISSLPADELTGLLFGQDAATAGKKDLASTRHCVIVYLLINKPRVLDEHWIFCADKDLLFSRISEQKLLSEVGFPEDETVICCDFTCEEGSPIWSAPDENIIERCVSDLAKLGFIKKDDVADGRVARIPSFYPSYKIGYEAGREAMIEKLSRIENIICTGRLGMVDYCNVDHCMDMAIFAAESLVAGKDAAWINRNLMARTKSYRIVD